MENIMKMMTRTYLGTVLALALALLGSCMAAAQEADPQALLEEAEQQYEHSLAAGDWEAFGSFFAENAIFMPSTGGIIDGREGILSWHQQSGITATDIRSSKTEMIGENLILDIGTFAATLPEDAGGTLEGEYVTVIEVGEDGLQIRSLSTFPVRQAPDAPAQE